MHKLPGHRHLLVWVLVLLFGIAWIGALGLRHLAKTDEGRYAEIPREMVATGDWLTPRLDGLKYFEKPALQYWATASAYELLGVSEFASRLWVGVTGLLCVAAIGATGARLFGRSTGIYAALILASSLLFVMMSHIDTLDMGLTCFMNLGLCAALLARAAPAGPAARLMMLGAWAAFGLAILSKGLVGLVLPGAVLVLYVATSRDWAFVRRMEPLWGPLVLLVITAPWFVAVSRANPGFFHFFFIHEHFERYLTTSHHREGPWWYFLPIVALGCLPWTGLVPGALGRAWRRPEATRPAVTADRFAPDRLLFIWVLFIFVFFSASGSKLPSYVLPLFPALALLVARHLTLDAAPHLARHALIVCVFAALAALTCVLAAPLGLLAAQRDAQYAQALAHFLNWLSAAAALLALGAGAGAALAFARRATYAVATIAASALTGALVGLAGYDALDHYASAHYVARALEGQIDPNSALYAVEIYDQTLPFYLGRTFTLVNERDELDFGLNEEPQKGVPSLDAFIGRWQVDTKAIAIMPPSTYRRLAAMNFSMRVILMDQRFVVIAKP